MDLITVKTFAQRVLYGHALNPPSRTETGITNPEPFRKLTHGHSFPFVRQKYGTACIECLRISCRPPAISWIISFIYVDAFKLMFARWRFSHVVSKLGEVIPFLTNSYPPTAVMRKVFVGWIQAPRAHVSPTIVGTGLPSAVSCFNVSAITSATFYAALSKLLAVRFMLRSAITDTSPPRLTQSRRNSFDNSKAVKFLAT